MSETRAETYAEYQRKLDAAANEEERGPIHKWYFDAEARRRDLAALEVRFENEKDQAQKSILALEAVVLAGRRGIPAPSWAVSVLDKAVLSVRSAECISWDEAFGQPWPDRTRPASAHKRETLGPLLWFEVRQLRRRNPDLTRDEALREARKKPGIGPIGPMAALDYYKYWCLRAGGPGIPVRKTRRKRRPR